MSIEQLDGGTPSTTVFDQNIDGGSPSSVVWSQHAEGGGVIRGDVVTAQGQTVTGRYSNEGTVATSQGGESVHATGTVTTNLATTSQGNQQANAVGSVSILGSVTTAQGSQHWESLPVPAGTIITAQGSQHVEARASVTPPSPPPGPTPTPTYGTMGGGGGYIAGWAGFRRRELIVAVCIADEEYVEVRTDFDSEPQVAVSNIHCVRDPIDISIGALRAVLGKMPSWNLNEIINTRESNIQTLIEFNKPEAKINDIITIDS